MDKAGNKATAERQDDASFCKVGRHAAGQDPIKRNQILNGAYAVFSRMGFDAASMNDITREANVSKGTIYVYFQNKEELFQALIESKCQAMFADLQIAIDGDDPVEEKLYRYGTIIARLVTCDPVIRGQRIVIAISERKPELGAGFYERGPLRGKRYFSEFLKKEVAKGTFIIDDLELAGYQFGELCMAGLFRPRIFGHMKEAPSAEAIEKSVRSAVRIFMKAYGTAEQGR
ncbi:MAG TPA: TetR/AcrR family transcriptional regulator [Pararhizobium sp.]|nr:TetR/AcrR family transcriptional regulator [Pararhizobium sp.]